MTITLSFQKSWVCWLFGGNVVWQDGVVNSDFYSFKKNCFFSSQRFCHGVRLLEKVVLQDNLSTLVVNLYSRNEGYSLMLKDKNGAGTALQEIDKQSYDNNFL